jgi:hypothetical protein
MGASITLQQERSVLDAVRYRVWSKVAVATPSDLYGAFLVQSGLDPWDEIFVRTATLNDVANYPENDLSVFVDPAVQFHTLGPGAGDVLRILTSLDEWVSSEFQPTQDFRVGNQPVSFDPLFIDPTYNQFPDARSGLAWQLWDATLTVLKGSGTGGYTRRALDGTTTWRRRHWMKVYTTSSAAEAHALAVDTGVHSLATDANITPPPFQGYSEVVYP